LARATPLEAKYILRILARELRIGLKESLVEEAIAQAFLPNVKAKEALKQVQRANMLLGDIGETLRLAAAGKLEQARMRLFHPIGFMLASPAQTAAEAHQYFDHAAVEDKYDGIRAQAHISGRSDEPQVRLFSRTLDNITGSFPELVPALASFSDDLILDGEIVAWSSAGDVGRALPFAQLQRRLGRKAVSDELLRAVPVAYVAFDVLYAEGELTLDRPLRERAAQLDRVFAAARRTVPVAVRRAQGALTFEPAVDVEPNPDAEVIRAPASRADHVNELEQQFEAALTRGNEGLMVKDLESPYAPGRRGKSWLKLKRELATLDVVVTAVEWGHGKRAGVLSDYTFAVRDGQRLVNVGKAYSGLTDAEIAEMTRWFQEHTLTDEGWRRTVEPKIVLEVAFNAVMRSDRHESGYALRFPRILRIRSDKPVEEVDTLERVREIYDSQKWPEDQLNHRDTETQRQTKT
jgi:DNA ligase-1